MTPDHRPQGSSALTSPPARAPHWSHPDYAAAASWSRRASAIAEVLAGGSERLCSVAVTEARQLVRELRLCVWDTPSVAARASTEAIGSLLPLLVDACDACWVEPLRLVLADFGAVAAHALSVRAEQGLLVREDVTQAVLVLEQLIDGGVVHGVAAVRDLVSAFAPAGAADAALYLLHRGLQAGAHPSWADTAHAVSHVLFHDPRAWHWWVPLPAPARPGDDLAGVRPILELARFVYAIHAPAAVDSSGLDGPGVQCTPTTLDSGVRDAVVSVVTAQLRSQAGARGAQPRTEVYDDAWRRAATLVDDAIRCGGGGLPPTERQ